MTMLIEDVMTKEVRSCHPEDGLDQAARMMAQGDCGCVPVADADGRCVGMLTDRDICLAAYATGKRLVELHVADVMAKQVVSCLPHDDIAAAELMMRQHQIRRLPVLGFEDQLVGIVSLNDLSRAAARPEAYDRALSAAAIEETLAAVCAPRAPHVTSAA
jgi:CBS domain-containing protein